MGWKMEPCPRCGGSKAIVAKLCRKCHGETTNSPICPSCGGKKSYDSKLCRKCQGAQGKSRKPCPGCGTRIQSAATQCRACYDKARAEKAAKYLCADCGQPTKQYASTRYAERCRDCDIKHRRYRPKKPCSVGGCLRPHQAKGFCVRHYQEHYRKVARGKGIGAIPFRLLALWPCQLCGYDRLRSAIHRLIPGAKGGQYVPGNMVALCSNCHREVHAGVAVAPSPPSETEILATRQGLLRSVNE